MLTFRAQSGIICRHIVNILAADAQSKAVGVRGLQWAQSRLSQFPGVAKAS